MVYITDKFSLNMIFSYPANVRVEEVGASAAAELVATAESAVGCAAAAVFTSVLGVSVALNRVTIALGPGDTVVVGMCCRGGSTELPEGATITWLLVTIL